MRRRPYELRPRPLACGMLAAALLVGALPAGCGDSGGGGTQPGSAVNTQLRRALTFSRCMRSNGVPDFPDPNSRGGLVIHGERGTGLDPDAPAFQAALKKCGPFPSSVTPGQERQAFERALKAAVCMRAKGVLDYPEPQWINGTIRISFAGVNYNAPTFQTARKKCGYQNEQQLIGAQPAGG